MCRKPVFFLVFFLAFSSVSWGQSEPPLDFKARLDSLVDSLYPTLSPKQQPKLIAILQLYSDEFKEQDRLLTKQSDAFKAERQTREADKVWLVLGTTVTTAGVTTLTWWVLHLSGVVK